MDIVFVVGVDVPQLTAFGPSNIEIDPANISTGGAVITRIDYAWGDGTTSSIKRTGFLNNDGDPRSKRVTHQYLPKRFESVSNFSLEIWVHYSTSATAVLAETVSIRLVKTQIVGANTGYSRDIHLISNRIWGNNNKRVFALESVDPSNVFLLTPSNRYVVYNEIPPAPEPGLILGLDDEPVLDLLNNEITDNS